jgi:hypothetical protein
LHARHPVPLEALRGEIRERRERGAERIGIIGFSSAGHLAGLAALTPSTDESESVDFVVMGYPITSMETESYRPSRIILLGEHATPQLRRETSLDALVTTSALGRSSGGGSRIGLGSHSHALILALVHGGRVAGDHHELSCISSDAEPRSATALRRR